MRASRSAGKSKASAPRSAGDNGTLERILAVTMRRIRQGGFASVSMRQVADELGITATALYHHFNNKDALLDRVAERIYDSIPMPESSLHWTARLRALVLAQQKAHLDYPGLARFLLVRRSESPGAFRWVESILQILHEGGLTDDEKILGLTQLSFLINPLTYLDVPHRRVSRARFRSKATRFVQGELERFPRFAALVDRIATLDYETQYAIALDAAIEVLSAHVESRRSAASRRVS